MRNAATLACFLVMTMAAAGQSPRASEYEVKAAFLYNFAKFVEWPSQAFAGSSAALRICLLGRDPFGDALDSIVLDKTVAGHPIVRVQAPSPAEARACHVLFISRSEPETLKPILDRISDLPMLTVSESRDFLRLGGMINFVVEQDRVRFEINLDAAERHHLKLSSKLLAVARVVNTGGGAN